MSLSPTQRRRIRVLDDRPAGALLVHEIYRSLQGEGTFAGLPCTFVRLTACHLRCTYCDTRHAFHEGGPMTIEEIERRVADLGGELVEITGGEPLLQHEVFPLMTRLADSGMTVLVETSGAVDTSPIDPRVRVILDIKTPGSGEAAANLDDNWARLKPIDEVKFVVTSRDDFAWAAELIREKKLTATCPVLISPVPGCVEPAEVAAWILESKLSIRLQLQLHKIVWGAETRGV